MSESLSRRVFFYEALFIAAPLSVCYLIFGLPVFVFPGVDYPNSHFGVLAVLGIAVYVSVLSAWVLILSFLRRGTLGLRGRGETFWILSFVGVGIVSAAAMSVVLPDSPEYSEMWSFRNYFDLFALGLPLVLPLSHLLFERKRVAGL